MSFEFYSFFSRWEACPSYFEKQKLSLPPAQNRASKEIYQTHRHSAAMAIQHHLLKRRVPKNPEKNLEMNLQVWAILTLYKLYMNIPIIGLRK